MEQKKITIAMLQMSSVIGDVEANIKKAENLLNEGIKTSVDVIVFPEVWTVGWSCSKFQASAQDISTGSVGEFLSQTARKYNANIIGGSVITKTNNQYFNTCPVYKRNGELVTTYSKMHLYSYYGCDENKYVKAGEKPILVELDGIKYGLTICYDIRFPELYREYAKAGADVLINCAAWGSKKPIPWEVMTKSRAVENQCYMVALTQSGYIENGEYNLGQSRIIDYKGEEIVSIMSGEGVAIGDIFPDLMYDFRKKSPTLNDIKDSYEVKILCKK